jgi:hypothetical protein
MSTCPDSMLMVDLHLNTHIGVGRRVTGHFGIETRKSAVRSSIASVSERMFSSFTSPAWEDG